jgi:hypothetical protein
MPTAPEESQRMQMVVVVVVVVVVVDRLGWIMNMNDEDWYQLWYQIWYVPDR